jgi:hypothetical protein
MNNHNNRRKTNIITTTGEKQTQPRTETQKGSMNVMTPEQQDYSMKTQDIERQEMDQSMEVSFEINGSIGLLISHSAVWSVHVKLIRLDITALVFCLRLIEYRSCSVLWILMFCPMDWRKTNIITTTGEKQT